MLELTYFGNATVGIAASTTSILIDPYIAENSECPFDIATVLEMVGDGETVDAVCVTHLGYDHVGDAVTLATEYGCPVITEPGTNHYLTHHGVADHRITQLTSGMKATVGELTVRALEARHVSTTTIDDRLVTGEPLGFLVGDGGSSVYHLGDTSLFSDLELFGDRYEPDVALIGVGQAHSEAEDDGPVTRILHELTTDEAVTAARWIGSDQVVPIHYLPDEKTAFREAMNEATDVPDVVSLEPGDTLSVE
ncbi:MAG: MBL fold metallo-hydrolase [Halobacteriales archaeon]|nr:MBL fold metallo-hydrolase [Halobacteriales archaeon]